MPLKKFIKQEGMMEITNPQHNILCKVTQENRKGLLSRQKTNMYI